PGWWQCQDGANGASVAGGQRQFMKQGQRVPQALLLQPQTWWEKLRGVQSSLQRDQPTSWTLVDRRGQARVTPPIQLALPGPATGGAGRALGQTDSTAIAGSFAGTGLPCPASGWWRCDDEDAP